MSNLLTNILALKCPRCRKGNLFVNKHFFKWKEALKMPNECPVCKLHYEIEEGFWWGTGYVNYALTVAITVVCVIIWSIFVGFKKGFYDIFYLFFIITALILILQPWIMKTGRALYIHIFVKYDKNLNKQ